MSRHGRNRILGHRILWPLPIMKRALGWSSRRVAVSSDPPGERHHRHNRRGREGRSTYNFSHVVFVTVCLHVPNDLVAEQLRHLSGLKNEIGNVTCGKSLPLEGK